MGWMDQPQTPHSVKDLSDRELMEALYRAVYGEKPVHAGIATRTKRLETGFWALLLVVVGFEGAARFLIT